MQPRTRHRDVAALAAALDHQSYSILRWVVYEGHFSLSPEKAPDPKTGIFKPWILRTTVN